MFCLAKQTCRFFRPLSLPNSGRGLGLLRNVGSQNKLPNGFSHPMLPTGVGYITRCFLRSRGSITNCHGDPRRLQHTHIVVSITNGQHFRRADSEEFCQHLRARPLVVFALVISIYCGFELAISTCDPTNCLSSAMRSRLSSGRPGMRILANLFPPSLMNSTKSPTAVTPT